jgi:hypothetical protein
VLAALHGGPAHRLDRDRERLHHCCDPGTLDIDREHLVLGRDEMLLQAAVEVDPDQLEVVARVRSSDAARVAVTTRDQWPDRDELAHGELLTAAGSQRRDPRSDLMPKNPRKLRAARLLRELTEEEVVIGSADSDGLGREQHLAVTRLWWLGAVDHDHRAGCLCHRRAHPPQPRASVSTEFLTLISTRTPLGSLMNSWRGPPGMVLRTGVMPLSSMRAVADA